MPLQQRQSNAALSVVCIVAQKTVYLNPYLQGGCGVHDIGFTVFSKNLSFTHRLGGHFLEALWNQEPVLCAVMKVRIQG